MPRPAGSLDAFHGARAGVLEVAQAKRDRQRIEAVIGKWKIQSVGFYVPDRQLACICLMPASASDDKNPKRSPGNRGRAKARRQDLRFRCTAIQTEARGRVPEQLPNFRDGNLPPTTINRSGKEMVEEVVSMRDRREHFLNATTVRSRVFCFELALPLMNDVLYHIAHQLERNIWRDFHLSDRSRQNK